MLLANQQLPDGIIDCNLVHNEMENISMDQIST